MQKLSERKRFLSGIKVWAAFVKPKAESWEPKEENYKKTRRTMILFYHLPAIPLSLILGLMAKGSEGLISRYWSLRQIGSV